VRPDDGIRVAEAGRLGSLQEPVRPLEQQEVEMPSFPDFVSAVELVRRQTRTAGQADPVGQYFAALNMGDAHALETGWPGEVVIYDPRAGEVRGHQQVRQFVSRNLSFSAGGGIGLEHCAVTDDGLRCALEYNLVRWGSHDLPPQAGLGVYERGPDGLLAAARVYDDVETPTGHRGPAGVSWV